MVKLRLRRMGRKSRPVYDIVASDSRTPRDGRFLEKVGQYNPLIEDAPVTILKRDRVLYWLGTGAQPTDTVRSLLSKEGVLLEIHMKRKGRDQQDIDAALEQHTAKRNEKRAAAPAKKAPAAETAAPQAATVAHDFSATEASEARAISEPPTSIMEPAPAADAPVVEEAPAAEAPAADAPAADEAPAADAPTEG